ncbi:expressed unknown protein [Seminavis robusta]|uniref:Uncharacterized protein n=1 Tax=Seminavis robusta TaxID=568900 RepID=A0A9N8EG21_9STRA|nr:expressed unknown protein [Seminavis robusta]|eukprot:Sro1103_g241720.1 n/a (158) ;mRNA; f:28618-29091
MFETLSRALFFSDVPEGRIKHKPVIRPAACGMGEVFTNLGTDIHNAFFFDDLKSVANQTQASMDSDDSEKTQTPPEEEFDMDDETSLQLESRGQTMGSPAVNRVQRYNERVAVSKRQAELLEIAEGLDSQRKHIEEILGQVKNAAELEQVQLKYMDA